MHTVTFSLDGGHFLDGTEESITVKDESTVKRPSDPEKESCKFINWYSDEDGTSLFDFDTPITQDTTIYAKWESEPINNPRYFTIKYSTSYSGAGTTTGIPENSQSVAEGSKPARPTDPVLKEDEKTYVFEGWYDTESNEPFDFEQPITGNKTLEAKWSDSYYDDNGYTVGDEAGLVAWSEAVLDNPKLNCTLERDIMLTAVSDGESNWNPVKNYSGTFDGNNKTISGMKITGEAKISTGLISNLESDGTVKDLGLIGVDINISSDLSIEVGAIAGISRGIGTAITNCYSTGTISVTVEGQKVAYAGGIIGQNNSSTITACYSSGTITAREGGVYAGGITGQNDGADAKITACYSSGTITARNAAREGGVYAGGITGQNDGADAKITACYFTGSVSAGTQGNGGYVCAGGIAGETRNGSTITACYSTGSISSYSTYAGGICGISSSTVDTCYWSSSGGTAIAGIGDGTDNTLKVENDDWLTAINTMNTKLNEVGATYKYTNGDSDRPLIIHP